MIERNQYVANQDKVVIEDLRPVLTPDTNTKEFMVPADKVHPDVPRQAQVNGTPRAGESIRGRSRKVMQLKVAYAIPESLPAGSSKGWVLDAIPLD